MKSADFERTDGGGAWWGWKAEKRWLETLFAQGELMVARRETFIAFTTWRSAWHRNSCKRPSHPTPRRFTARLHRACRGRTGGNAGALDYDYFRQKPRLKDADLDALVAGAPACRSPGLDMPGYVHTQHAALLRRRWRRNWWRHTALLSPFDPVVGP